MVSAISKDKGGFF
jgi:hypothetical protein